jgi:hypothetical protein
VSEWVSMIVRASLFSLSFSLFRERNISLEKQSLYIYDMKSTIS